MKMKTVLAIVLFLASWIAATAWANQNGYARQVVEVNVTFQLFDPLKPWSKLNPGTRQTTAVVVEGPYLLTTAQMVEDATFIEAKKFGGPDKAPARVVHADPEINLALLTVDEEGFYDGLEKVRLAEAAPITGIVTSVRWKSGQLEASTSRVARMEVRQSFISDIEHMIMRVKSDFAGGGWAEPVFRDDLFVGLTVSQDEDLADVMAPELISAYLREAGNPDGYRGFGNLGFAWQSNVDKALAGYLGLEGPPRGVIILEVPWGASGCNILRPRDVLLALGGYDIDGAGFYQHPRYGRLRFTNISVDGRFAGDTIQAGILRDGKRIDVDVVLRRYMTRDRLIPWKQYSREPAYLIAGGLVFRELDGEYLSAWGDDWRRKADIRLVTYWNSEKNAQKPDRRRIILLAYVLPSAYNIGYHNMANLAVKEVNGVAVDSIADVEEGFGLPRDGYHKITFFPNRDRNELILDAAAFEAATGEMLSLYNIPASKRLPPEPSNLNDLECHTDPPPAAGHDL